MKRTVLIVDDDKLVRDSLCERLELEGYRTLTAADAEKALEVMRDDTINIAVVDVNLPGMSGLELMEGISRISPGTGVVILTGFGSVEDAVAAMKKGAADYLLKPCSIDELKIVLSRISDRQALQDENVELKRRLEERYGLGSIIGGSAVMRQMFDRIEAVARSDANVLLEGETGTGKDLVAHAIHGLSSRRDRPFVKVDCAALPETLLESELFGHERGAFTGATRSQAGRFEQADGGVVFLDEIGNLSQATQARLLNVIQDREFTRLGGERRISVDIRLISATNIDLERAVADGKFREDLFYRLNVVPVLLPPLRERRDDIPMLVNSFLDRFCRENKRDTITISPEALDRLCNYNWPGNVRELENVIERVVILFRGTRIEADDLPSKITGRHDPDEAASALPDGVSLKQAVEHFESRVIQSVLGRLGGSREQTASRLGVTRVTLYNKMKRYGLLGEE